MMANRDSEIQKKNAKTAKVLALIALAVFLVIFILQNAFHLFGMPKEEVDKWKAKAQMLQTSKTTAVP
jgi:cytochrome c-type biogenesis protein CcmE